MLGAVSCHVMSCHVMSCHVMGTVFWIQETVSVYFEVNPNWLGQKIEDCSAVSILMYDF